MTFRFERTPAQEAYRIKRLREALLKPRSAQWKERISAGLKKAFVEGRIPKRTRESIEKTAAKLRGRKRPPEVVEKIRQANTGKKRSLEQRQAMGERVKKGYAQGLYRKSPEARASVIEATRRANTGRVHSAEQNRRHSEALRGRKQASEVIERRVTPMRNRPQTALLTRKGPNHKNGISGALRSPENVVYEFRNLTHFVREHPYLFNPDDVIWRKPRSSESCRASKGLMNLFGKGKVVNGSWKGWTVYSRVEHVYNAGEDLLKRPWDIPVFSR